MHQCYIISSCFSGGVWLLIIEIFIVLLYDKISYGRGIYLEAVASIVTMYQLLTSAWTNLLSLWSAESRGSSS